MKLIFFLLSLMALVACESKSSKTDWDKQNLKGKVKSIKETPYEAIGYSGEYHKKNLAPRGFANNEFSFDETGKLLKEISYNKNGGVLNVYTYNYDNKGLLLSKDTYDSKGNLEEKSVYKHDLQGNITEENSYNTNGKLKSNNYYIYRYNEKGNQVERYVFVYATDEEGNFSFDENGTAKIEIIYKEENSYDQKGNKIKSTIQDLFLGKTEISYEYDNRGNLVRKIEAGGVLDGKENVTCKYKFDSKGNWIEMTKTITSQGHSKNLIIERNIEYY